ncbi:MAG: hypothetical protein HIU83_11970 [Proteobacteria bacterium]|nr:hypothetical protein [Pseudomonadota bacterium]
MPADNTRQKKPHVTVIQQNSALTTDKPTTPLFKDFAEEWYLENEIGWKRSYRATLRITYSKYLLPIFGEEEVSRITKGQILKFRSTLAKVQNGTKEGLSNDRINHILTPLRMILSEAADRFNFSTPYVGINHSNEAYCGCSPHLTSGSRHCHRVDYLSETGKWPFNKVG